MATNNKYNDFGKMMIENRPTMEQFNPDMVTEGDMTKTEWKNYLAVCDDVASTAYDYMANPSNPNGWSDFRNAMHKLYAFVGCDTRILAIDGYSVRFIPACVPFKVVKSERYKNAEKAIRAAKKGMAWAVEITNTNPENPDAIIFPASASASDLSAKYYTADTQNEWNAVIPVWRKCHDNGEDLTVGKLTANINSLSETLTELGKEDWQCYRDFKNPMQSTSGKKLTHLPASIRKAIEDTMADILTARAMMTTAQLEKEHAQINGGRRASKKSAEAKKSESTTESK